MSSKKKYKKFQDNSKSQTNGSKKDQESVVSSLEESKDNVIQDAEFKEKDTPKTDSHVDQKNMDQSTETQKSEDKKTHNEVAQVETEKKAESNEEVVNPLEEDDAIAWRVIGGIFLIVIAFLVFNAIRKNRQDVIVQSDLLEVQDNDHIKGNREDAKVTIIEYSDLQCPACYLYEDIVMDLLESRGEEIRLVYRHFPLESIHPNAKIAAIATEAASQQGKFWDMKEILFEKQTEWSASEDPAGLFAKYATEIGLNQDQFVEDLSKDVVVQKVEDDLQSATDLKADFTPTFFVNGVKLKDNPSNLADFEKLIDDELKK